jgi:DNA (cytosine-5)-methyltransferase 1
VDLFCGAGGMSLGFEQAGFDVVVAIDSDPLNTTTHEENFPDCRTITADISKLTGREVRAFGGIGDRHIDVLFGGPPCQGFSLIGHRDAGDPRNMLLLEFARLAKELRPAYVVCENVAGLALGSARKTLESFARRLVRAGYNVVRPIEVLDASHYGVPQHRQRVFVIASLRGLPIPSYPVPQSGYSLPTVWDAIGDLVRAGVRSTDEYRGRLPKGSYYAATLRRNRTGADDFSRERVHRRRLTGCSLTKHTDDTILRFKKTRPGSYEPISRFYRLCRCGQANTIRAGTGSSHGSYTAARPIHPTQPRCITVREAARLHSFPDWFRFNKTVWHGFRQVGNSVPPLLARTVANEIIKCLSRRVDENSTSR